MTPSHIPSGVILVTAHEAKVKVLPIFDRILLLQTEREFSMKIPVAQPRLLMPKWEQERKFPSKGIRIFRDKSAYKIWPEPFYKQCVRSRFGNPAEID